VIRIRNEDFSAGTHNVGGQHGRAERSVHGVMVYLLPGLTSWQRRAVIRRLRQEASRGFGPPMPLPQLAIALGLDRVRTAARIVKAIARLHPVVTLVPSAFVVVMMTLFVIAAGDRPGIPGMRGGLADAAAASGGSAGTLSAGPVHASMTGVPSGEWTGGTAGGGAGLGSAQRVPARQAHGAHSKVKPLAGAHVRQGLWYVCPQAMTTTTSRPSHAQLACRRPAARAAPPTAHLPGPLDFAW
jgi:hypothetical protein